MDKDIALRIAGTRSRRGGFAPLVAVGVLAGGEGASMDRSPLISECPSYVIKHAQEYILYLLVDRKVKPFDADTSGVLSIALTIPKGKQLENGGSPYTLLKEAYDKFLELYMVRLSDGGHSFSSSEIDGEVFRAIAGKYGLEPRRSAYVPMNPQGLTGIACVPQEQLEAFFRDTQYSEFAEYKDIEVGTSCHGRVSPGLKGLEVPRPVNYAVWVDGKETGRFLSKPDEVYTASRAGDSLYEYAPVSFTLGDLLASEGFQFKDKAGSAVRLDKEHNRIDCRLKKEEIRYKLQFGWVNMPEDTKEGIYASICGKKLSLKFGGAPFNWTSNPSVPASKVKESASIEPNEFEGYRLSVSTSANADERVLTVTIKGEENKPEKRMPTAKRTQAGGHKQPQYYSKKEQEPASSSQGAEPSSPEDGQSWLRKNRRTFRGLCLLAAFLLGIGATLSVQSLVGGEETPGNKDVVIDSLKNRIQELQDCNQELEDAYAELKEKAMSGLVTVEDSDKVEDDNSPSKSAVPAKPQTGGSKNLESDNDKRKRIRQELSEIVRLDNLQKWDERQADWTFLEEKEKNVADGLLRKGLYNSKGKRMLTQIKEKFLSNFNWNMVDTIQSELYFLKEYKIK